MEFCHSQGMEPLLLDKQIDASSFQALITFIVKFLSFKIFKGKKLKRFSQSNKEQIQFFK